MGGWGRGRDWQGRKKRKTLLNIYDFYLNSEEESLLFKTGSVMIIKDFRYFILYLMGFDFKRASRAKCQPPRLSLQPPWSSQPHHRGFSTQRARNHFSTLRWSTRCTGNWLNRAPGNVSRRGLTRRLRRVLLCSSPISPSSLEWGRES